MTTADLAFPSTGGESSKFSFLRRRMVREQLELRGIRGARVLQAMAEIPREWFVPRPLRDHAYEDHALPIGRGQTISQPYTVALMLQALALTGEEKVLEIGTGSGYNAALLSLLAKEVHSVERIQRLALRAEFSLLRCHASNVTVHHRDGSHGLSEFAPFDAISVTAAAEKLPLEYLLQLSPGGRLVIPVGDARGQSMLRYVKGPTGFTLEDLGRFTFVRLIAGETA